MTRHIVSLSALTLVATVALGCETREPRDAARENTGARAEALTGEVEQASAAPSGDVARANLDGLLSAYAEIDYAIGDMGMPCDLDPFAFDGAASCAIDADGDTLDVSCTSSGAASGTVSVDVHIAGGDTFVHYAFDNVCAADRDVCVTGEGAVKVSATGNVVVAGELTITRDGVSSETKYGVTVSATGSVDVVVWHDGQSFVVHTDALGGVELEGADGAWSCELEGRLDDFDVELAGSCSLGADTLDI